MDNTLPLRLLSLDGGGIRGLASLIILKHLMQLVNHDNPPKPCEYFDLIGGTSTGGLIAIMLGRLQMGVDECIRKYLDVSSAAFQPKRSKANIFGRAKGFFKGEGAYQGDQLAAEFKKAALDFEGNEDAKLLCPNSLCKVFVCSFEKAFNTPTLFRTYATEATRKVAAAQDCSIWEAARATSAAATFFDPITIGQQSYVDGATGFNNPVEIVVEEARNIWPDALSRIQSIVSIGTGVPEPNNFGDGLKGILLTLKAIATETEQTHLRFLKNHEDLGLKGRYFRFNVTRGLKGVRLDDHAKITTIDAATRLYLNSPEAQVVASSFTSVSPPKICFMRMKDRNHILGWLPSSDQRHFVNEASILRRNEDTGNWFIQGQFNAWVHQGGSLLWLYAGAGSGKTVLTSKIIESIENQGCDLLAYYYFCFQQKEYQTLRDFKNALIVQFVERLSQQADKKKPEYFYVPHSFVHLRDKYYPSRSPNMEDLDMTLLEIINRSPRTFIIIDALDECDNLKLQSDILNFVQQLLENAATDLYTLITSRPEVGIDEAIRQMPVAKRLVAFDTNEVDEDIRSHLNLLMEEPPYSRWSKPLQHNVVAHIAQRSGGVFRWADLQVQALRGKSREVDVNRALRNLPKTLGETYKRMLDRIEFENYRQEAVAVLRWLNRARTPLTLVQVAELAAFDVQTTNTEYQVPASDDYKVAFLRQNRFGNPSEIYRILSGLITVSGSFETSTPKEMIVSFSHFSVQEYLESSESPAEFKLLSEEYDWFIYKSCLAYLDDYDSSQSAAPFQPTHPLLLYACLQLWNHTEELLSCPKFDGDKEHRMQSIAETLRPLLCKSEYAFKLALQRAGASLTSSSENVGRFIRSLSHPFRDEDLQTAICIGDPHLLTFLLHAGVAMPKNALLWAVQEPPDRGRLVEPFRAESIERASALPNSEQALTLALRSNTSAEARLAPSPMPDCVVSNESIDKRRSIWDLIMTNPEIDLNATNFEHQTPLLVAALCGDEPFFRFLVALEDTKRDHCDIHRWSLATCALIGGNEDIIKFVLNNIKIDLEAVDQYGWTPLEWASYRGLDAMIVPLNLPLPAHEKTRSVSPKTFLSFKEVRNCSYGAAEVWGVDFSNSGTYLAISLSNGQCIIYDVSSATTSVILRDHNATVGNASWNPDDTLSGLLIKTIEFENMLSKCAWLPNGQAFILSSYDRHRSLSQFRVSENKEEDGKGLRFEEEDCFFSHDSFKQEYRTSYHYGFDDVVVSPDGLHIVAIGCCYRNYRIAGQLYIYQAQTKSLQHSVEIPRGSNVAVHPDSRSILLGLESGGHHIINIADGTVIREFPAATTNTYYALVSTFGGLNGLWMLRPERGKYHISTIHGYISIWDCDSGRLLGHLAGHYPKYANCVSWRPGSPYEFVSGGDDGYMRM
ncbi:hypothetical protein HD806DRAFT_545036 [Xylariaceae sp. AK1471]|nr:hypothetical protein HD806DRAFT_545036 [Xylariaceae sp. AK1471]